MMIVIRLYQETDAPPAGKLIAATYAAYNLAYLPPQEQAAYLGPFHLADSADPDHQEQIARTLWAPLVLVAENEVGELVGILRGRIDRLHSLFVRGDMHRQGIGRRLMAHFEQTCLAQGGQVVRLASTLYAVPFYESLGYKKSTGVRRGWSFDGENFQWQPMKKILEVIS